MARSATIIILPVVHIESDGVDLARQRIHPSADRRKVVELWRFLMDREFAAMCAGKISGQKPKG